MNRIRKVLEGFLAIDLRTLAFVRVLTGVVIIIDLISRARDLTVFYTDEGVVPRSLLYSGSAKWLFTVFGIGGSWEFVSFLFILTGIFALLLAYGYKTRLMTILTWVMIMSLQNRNPLVCYGGDSVLRMLLFWGMFVPWGAKYSIDSLRYGFNRLSDHLPQKVFTVGTAGMALQVLYIYLFTALFKNGPEWHSEGTAVYYALAIDELASRFNYLGRMLPMEVLKALNWSVLAWEWIGPFLVAWPNWRVRVFGIIGFIALQAGFNFFMVLGLFPVFSTVAILVFVPSEVWDRLRDRLVGERTRGMRIFYDPDCGFCQHVVIALNRFVLFDGAQLIPANEDPQALSTLREQNSWTVRDVEGRSFSKGKALVEVFLNSPVFRFKGWLLKPFAGILDAIYGYVATNRLEMPVFRYFPNGIISRYSVKMSIPAIVMAVWCLLYVTLFNIHRYDEDRIPVPESLHWVSGIFKVDQNWAMFAPAPYRADGWYVMPAVLNNGDTVDLFTDGGPVDWDRPERVAATYRNTRWSKYLRTIRKGKYKKPLRYYVKWLRKDWNRRQPRDRKLREFTVYFVMETNMADWETEPPRRIPLWHQDCRKNTDLFK